MSVSTGDIVSRAYGNFRGVDFRGEEVDLRRSPDSLNVWKDYTETEKIQTRPRMHYEYDYSRYGKINSFSMYKGQRIVHAGTGLYIAYNCYYTGLNDSPSNTFVFNDIWYFMDGKHYIQYDGTEFKDVVGYIPTTSIGRKPEGGGTIHEDVNMLSDYRINTFVGDGESTKFYLDAMNIDESTEDVVVRVNGEVLEREMVGTSFVYTWSPNFKEGYILFNEAPPVPDTDGQDNVSIQFKKSTGLDENGDLIPLDYKNKILGCTLLQVFDNRVFVSGNEDHPNVLWHCSLNDPTYFSDLDYYREGMDSAQIKGMVAGNNALWVFREPSESNTNVFYHTPTIDSEYGKIYPSQHSSITTGCIGKAINFNDDIVFFSYRGMEGISGDITTEQAIAHRSTMVDGKLLKADGYKKMILAEYKGYLCVFIGNKVFLADSRTAFTYEDHIEYDWFYWELEKNISCAYVYLNGLYLGTEDGYISQFYDYTTDMEKGFESYWVTPKDKFKAPHKLKTTNKSGCVVEATGDISVYAKTENTDFELIGTYENVTDYFTSRIKRKKFKDIQLKFHSNTKFSLETATLECFIGGYIKR